MHGNGIMEISARGSLQVRGLNAVSAPLFAAAVEALGIELCESVPVLCDPLPDDPTALIESQAIAAALRQAIAEAALAARAESLRGDRRRRAHRSRRGSRRYPAARHPDQRRSKTSCRTRRRCLERDGGRRHRSARRGRCRAGFALDHRRQRESRRALPICCRRVTRPRREPGSSLARQPLGCIRSRAAHALSASGLPSAMPKPPP